MALLGTGGAMAALLLAAPQSQAQSSMVALEQARAEAEAGRALLVDIREPDEHATGVAAGARQLKNLNLEPRSPC